MLNPGDDKGGRDAELAFESDFACMEHDEQGFYAEYRCRFTDRRYDIKSGFRPTTGNIAIAAHQFLLQTERGGIESVAQIFGQWRILDAASLLETRPRIMTKKEGYSDTHYVLAPAHYWKEFRHIHA